MAAMQTERQEKDDDVKLRISERFIQSGEKEQLKELLRLKLVECGWRDEMKQQCREIIRKRGIEHVTVEDLVEEIQLNGRAFVPRQVKKDLLDKIQAFLTKELEDQKNQKMVVRLRLARWGRKDLPFYRIVAADARAPRDGKHLEILGTFNPIAASDGIKELRVNNARVRYWMAVGAQPSDRVAHLLGLANVLPMPPTREYTKKNVPKKDRHVK